MTPILVICVLLLVGQIALLAMIHGVSEMAFTIERRLVELERAGILLRPDGKHDEHMVMSRRAKLNLAERFARQRARAAQAGHGA